MTIQMPRPARTAGSPRPFGRWIGFRGALLLAVAATVLGRGLPAHADTPDAAAGTHGSDAALYDHFRLGWYHHLTGIGRLPEIQKTGAPLVIPYHDEALTPFLDRSQHLGLDILPEIPRKLIDDQDYAAVAAYVAEHDGHPAIIGWYLADEPGLKTKVDWSPPVMAEVAKAIRSRSDKPIYLCFSYKEMDQGDPLRYRDSFDVMLVNHYPYVLNQLGGAKAVKDLAYWKALIAKTNETAKELGRPWLNITQAIGPRKGKEHQGWRLPTVDEARFQLYWSVLHDAEGAIYFCYYWARAVQPAEGEPYAEDGRTWLASVIPTVINEFEPLAAALLPRHAIADGVTCSNQSVLARLYRDPGDGSSVLVIANTTPEPQQARLTLAQDTATEPELIVGGTPVSRDGDGLALTLAAHEVLVYRLPK